MRRFSSALLCAICAVLLVTTVACGKSDRDPLTRSFDPSVPISAERLGAELAARAGSGAAQDVAYLVAGAMIARCDTNPRDGLLTTSDERACLRTLTLHDAWSPPVTNILDTPPAVSEPGWLTTLLLALAVILLGPWAADRSVRASGWVLRNFTGSSWFRLWPPVRFLVALLAGLVVFAIAVVVLLLLDVGLPWAWSGRVTQFAALSVWPLRVLLALALVMSLGKAASLGAAAKRLKGLLGGGTSPVETTAAARPTPRNILICCDGTGNTAEALEEGRRVVSNVRKLYEVAQSSVESGWLQDKWYDDGVGTGTSGESSRLSMLEKAANWLAANTPAKVLGVLGKFRMILELGFGIGITENITQGYARIVQLYQPGDRIFIVGFSRGAYTARCIADVIDDIGLLRSDQLRHAPDIIQLYRYRKDAQTPVPLRRELLHPTVKIQFLGLWDTVASLGVPLWGWSFSIGHLWSNAGIGATDIRNCRVIRHALSMDEQRSQFFPTLFEEGSPAEGGPDLRQRWFRGSHAGVGGGYADTSLSDIALEWMINEATSSGLLVHDDWRRSVLKRTDQEFCPNPIGQVISQLDRQRAWRLSGAWPRWHPCSFEASAGFGVLDDSVRQRAVHARSLRFGTAPVNNDEILTLSPGEKANVAMRAHLGWNRTGVVLEQGACYRMTYVEGSWQDQEKLPCGPSGQDASGFDLRRLLGRGKRVIDGRWMELIGHVAHPRTWDTKERNGRSLLYYLLLRDPAELTRTLIPLGRHLSAPGHCVDVQVEAASGVFYGFANDWWLYYDNNSGSITLSIERLGDASSDPQIARYVVASDGGVLDDKRKPVAL